MSAGLIDPVGAGFPVIPSDSANLTEQTRAVWVGGAGNLRVDMVNGNTITFSGIAAGTLLPIQTRKIYSTATTATTILALY